MMDDAAAKAYVDSLMSVTSATVNPVIGTTSAGHITINPIGSLNTFTLGQGLSSEEQLELGALEQERTKLLKQKRVEIFKSMPASFRQFVVDTVHMEDFISRLKHAEIDDTELVKKINYLKSKDSRITLSGYSDSIYIHAPYQLLEFLSAEELDDAHATQTLEEELSASTDFINKHE